MITVIGPRDKKIKTSDETIVINVTSSSKTWTKQFSPFLLGPVKLYGPYGSFNMENAWQYAKVYKDHIGEDGNPNEDYWKWACEGWSNKRGVRYPMYKGASPEYSYWNGKKLNYIEARKQIYVPLYEKAVYDSGYFEALVQFIQDCLNDGQSVYFWDYDGYNHKELGLSFDDVLNDPNKPLGHAFVLANMVEKALQNNE